VNQLRVALQANDITGIQNAATALTQAGDYLNQQLGFYGAAQNRIAAAADLSQKMDLNFQAALAGKQGRRLGAGHSGIDASQDAGAGVAERPRPDAQNEPV